MTNSETAMPEKRSILLARIGVIFSFVRANLFVTALVILILLSVSYPFFRTISYFNFFNVNAQTLLDRESTKIFSSTWPQYLLIERINNEIPDDALIVVFRMADFAFYGQRNYISYVDEKIADHVLQKTPEDVWNFFRNKGVTHIYLPPYPLPSFYNSQLEKALASPEYSELLYDFNGFRLFRFREQKASVSIDEIIGEDFISNPEAILNWNYEPALKTAPSSIEGLTIVADNSLLSNIDKGTMAYRGRIKYEGSPLQYGYEYLFDNDRAYAFNASVTGNGYFEAFIQSQSLIRGEIKVEEFPIWSGVLNGNSREIDSQFALVSKQSNSIVSPETNPAYRMVFKLINGEYADIKNWSISEIIEEKELPFQVERRQNDAFENNGWKIDVSRSDAPYSNSNLPLTYGLLNSEEKNAIFVNAFDSRTSYVSSPAFYIPRSENPDPTDPDKRGASDIFLDPRARQYIQISFFAGGEGVIYSNAQIACQDNERLIEQSGSLPIVLSSEGRVISTGFNSPCNPKYIKLILAIAPDKYSVGKFGQYPAQLELQDLSMRMQFINLEKELEIIDLEEVPIAVEYYPVRNK